MFQIILNSNAEHKIDSELNSFVILQKKALSSGRISRYFDSMDERCAELKNLTYSDKEWRTLSVNNDLRIFSIIAPASPTIFCMKIIGEVNASPEKIASLLIDPAQAHQVDSYISSCRVLEDLDRNTNILHIFFKTRACRFVSAARDIVCVRHWYRLHQRTFLVLFRSVDYPNCPPQSGVVRADALTSGYLITSKVCQS
eukprot:TRINITY_DN1300_c0_g1_i1.p1 TRINITY_DN1300_c0_g1~~TRINITY_DN1300_c0_g1_i1.p1  ORF type:complete len:199 (-),score=28.70 TRINITY_DN1300_c0_g1_i1:134-730(-)